MNILRILQEAALACSFLGPLINDIDASTRVIPCL